MHHYSVVSSRSSVYKKEYTRYFTILLTIGSFNFAWALCDMGDNINFMPLVIYKHWGCNFLSQPLWDYWWWITLWKSKLVYYLMVWWIRVLLYYQLNLWFSIVRQILKSLSSWKALFSHEYSLVDFDIG